MDSIDRNLKVQYVPLSSLRHPEKNARRWTKEATAQLEESITRHGVVDPLIVNSAPERKGIIIGGNFRAAVLEKLKYEKVPVVFVSITDPKKEAELILRLNKNTGEWSEEILAELGKELGEDFLADVGFSSEELDDIFPVEETPEVFDLKKELSKIGITSVTVEKGDVYKIGDDLHVMCGDSMVEADMLTLMAGEKADMCMTDEPYVLDYTKGKKRHKSTEGFGYKRDRKYLETDSLPDDFVEKWTANIAKVAKPDFSIIAYEHPKNLRLLWNEMEKHWRYRGTIIWRVPNRVQGFAARLKFFNKFDIAVVATSGDVVLNSEPESDELLQNEYEAALFMTAGKPTWESYAKGKKYCPSDFVEHVASDAKNSGQGVVFGTKPVPILIPYIKVLTKRGDLVVEPFGGSGSTAVAAWKLGRRCYLMEKSNVYTAVILKRLEMLTGLKAEKIHGR